MLMANACRFSPPLQEEPSDVREEEPHLRLRHGLHHQRHADRSQSDAEERHGVAGPALSCMLHGGGRGHVSVDRSRTTRSDSDTHSCFVFYICLT